MAEWALGLGAVVVVSLVAVCVRQRTRLAECASDSTPRSRWCRSPRPRSRESPSQSWRSPSS